MHSQTHCGMIISDSGSWTRTEGASKMKFPKCRNAASFLPRSVWLDHAEMASTGFMIASDGVLYEGYGHDGPGVCRGVGHIEAEGVPLQGVAATYCYGICPHVWPDAEKSTTKRLSVNRVVPVPFASRELYHAYQWVFGNLLLRKLP